MAGSKQSKRAARRASRQAARRRKTIFRALVVVLVLAAAVYLIWTNSQPPEALADAEVLAKGEAVYQQYCAACHGDQGQGHVAVAQAPALDETEHAWHHPDGQLREIISQGGSLMPPFGDQLSENEILAVIRYMQSWWTQAQLDSQQDASQAYPFD